MNLNQEAGLALMSTSNLLSTPVKWHSIQNEGDVLALDYTCQLLVLVVTFYYTYMIV